MEVSGICSICGRSAVPAYTCRVCGSVVCSKCFNKELGVCILCAAKFRK